MANSAEKKAFIEKMWNAIKGLDLNGLFPSVLIAQAALESEWGKSELASKHNNYFGIKKHNWKGKTVKYWTTEYDKNGNKYRVLADFRAYDTLEDGIADRNKFLRENKRYTLNGVFDAKTPEEQVQALKNAGYATGLKYVSSIMNTINANNLTEYDNLKKKTKQRSNVISSKEDKMGKNISIVVLILGVAIVGISIFSLIKSIRK